LQKQVDDLTAGSGDVAALQAQLAELTEAKAALDAQLGERTAEIEAMTTRVAELEVERDGITASKAELETGLEGKDAELADLRGQLEALQQQVASVAEERSALQEQLVEVQEDLSEVEALRSAALSFGSAAALSDALANLPAIKKHAVTAAIVAGVQPTLSPRIQALTDVKGIGSAYQQRLYKAGVGTYWELASVPDADLETTLEIPELQRARIDFAETRADAYEWAKLTDAVGLLWDGDHVDDFESLPGIGKTFEKRLYEAGITTYEQLTECDTERLAGIIKPPPMRRSTTTNGRNGPGRSWPSAAPPSLTSRPTPTNRSGSSLDGAVPSVRP
jgi:predicted flap endonuclease-1-like 5' DNA nuclease